ncbi:TerC family protein [Microvirga makkahensis]|uniref:TerC/Alx family metal homeostasis membrane protein n=1 Tax=Microvirga makkahensis TaxID=1128670 RepID=A0A7X3SQR3_9HYPH|nr:TerC family protein [Microvirga makkahensis]MXQ13625.1 TerC/Alx family metal homeostasis membrane protein [Microvirga makkahensis]
MPEILSAEWLGKPAWMWTAFLSFVVVLLAFDLGVLNRKDKELGVARSLWLSAFYIAIAMIFGAALWWASEHGFIATEDGSHAGISYFTGFFIEKSLSIDNVFVISLIFAYFSIPRKYQYRALVWGIIGVIVLRGIMIAAGAALVHEYAWVLYVFGVFLILTGIKMLFVPESNPDLEHNIVVRSLYKYMRTTHHQHENHFFVRVPHPETGKLVFWATPLFLALVVINIADLIFAIDSVPAIFAITTDTFVVYTANIMAILGLRALYFALAAMVHRFHYLKYALALVLIFIGGKIFWNQIVGKVDPAVSLGVTLALILGGIFYSLWRTRSEPTAAEQHWSHS